MHRKLCFSPHFFSVAKVFSCKNASFFSIAKVFVAKFSEKMSFAKVYALNFAIFSSRETFCPKVVKWYVESAKYGAKN